MAQRRMFSPDIVSSDDFLDMPVSSQVLYFHLGLRADDDGFITPKMVMRLIGSNQDDLKVLIAKRFILPFESGVVVIKHWLIHNLIRADLYKETLYKKEKKTLGLNENGAYTELREGVSELKQIESPEWLKKRRGNLRTANVPQTAPRLGKGRVGQDRLGKDNNTKQKNKTKQKTDLQEVVDHFYILKGWDYKNPKYSKIYARFTRPASELLELTDGNVEESKRKITTIRDWAESRKLDWTIETVFKKWFDIPELKPAEKKPYWDGQPMFKDTSGQWKVIMRDGTIKKFSSPESEITYE